VSHDFFAKPEQWKIMLVDTVTVREAVAFIQSCERCNPKSAEISFDYILDQLTGADPVTDYLLELPARCPNCRRKVLQETLIESAKN